MAEPLLPAQIVRMKQFGENLRYRARSLQLTDAEVARRVGIGERRYGFYVTGDREPDLTTLIRISEVLDTSIDALVKSDLSIPTNITEADALKEKLNSTASSLDLDHLGLLCETANGFCDMRELRRPN